MASIKTGQLVLVWFNGEAKNFTMGYISEIHYIPYNGPSLTLDRISTNVSKRVEYLLNSVNHTQHFVDPWRDKIIILS